MQNGISGLSCNAKVWGAGGIAGVVIFLLLVLVGVGAFLAFLVGVLICVGGGIAGRNLYCTEGGALAEFGSAATPETPEAPEPGPAPEPVRGPEPATAPEAAAYPGPSEAESETTGQPAEVGPAPAEEVPGSAATATPEAQAEVLEGEASRPETLAGPRAGQADDLKQLKGLGPKLEESLNAAGIYHFDQIAAWSADEVAWVEDNVDGVRGRVTRDDWVEQARALTATPQG
ncbi:hypothetical protein [Allosediminivita pacifica]|uniref:Putative flap endonuclease-1-like 5' DNA nuclease n=1 Tax=Allosediminivita pacifica TaxID=1267769 RepID=A0A2T6B2A4_9RHOB|nr:hypothetical protein [Allosediminivita pacifica]PTX50210.1 putative flap endonuclease-1-like 5' DNA nuclease [Allosediminivita pacifica]GGB02332.1 hypothetical protein GCM10011324_10660 [Allosediminivita pacifica]